MYCRPSWSVSVMPVPLDHDQRVLGEGLHLVEVDHHVPCGVAQVERARGGWSSRPWATVCLCQTNKSSSMANIQAALVACQQRGLTCQTKPP